MIRLDSVITHKNYFFKTTQTKTIVQLSQSHYLSLCVNLRTVCLLYSSTSHSQSENSRCRVKFTGSREKTFSAERWTLEHHHTQGHTHTHTHTLGWLFAFVFRNFRWIVFIYFYIKLIFCDVTCRMCLGGWDIWGWSRDPGRMQPLCVCMWQLGLHCHDLHWWVKMLERGHSLFFSSLK